MSTVAMTAPDGVRFEVATGALCLDFVYTGGAAERARWEALHTPADLERWLRSSRLAAAAPIPAVVHLTETDLTDVHELREVLWRLGNDLADGQPVRAGDAEALNRWARQPDLVAVLVEGRAGWAGPMTGQQLLSTLARDAIALVTGPHAGRVRRCAAADCALLFIDTSRPGTRRWCAMSRCGNRTKARSRRAHRHDTPKETP
ncbi:MAG: ABATE domain-containing protein [Pseudonocardia sp.]|nr:ABATE domain-containing protein [Pseudonocardia sp.]